MSTLNTVTAATEGDMKDINRSEQWQSRQGVNDIPVVLAGFRLLRLSPAQWRETVSRLSSPLMRLGHMRQVRSRAWQAAIVEQECGDQGPPSERGGELCA